MGLARERDIIYSFAGGHRSVIMNSNNGKVLSSLIKLIQNGTEKVCLYGNYLSSYILSL